MLELKIDAQRRNQILILTMAGNLTQLETLKLRAHIDRETREGVRFVILDFGRVVFIDSAGVGTVNSIRSQIEKLNGTVLIVRTPNSTIAQILDQCALSRLIRCFENQHEALKEIADKFGGGTTTVAFDPTDVEALREKLISIEKRIAMLESAWGASLVTSISQ
jgi:anti-anti-sigma factor